MKDEKLREAFRALVRHLNLKISDYWGSGYEVKNYPIGAGCNVARLRDIKNLQEQIDELKKKVIKKTK